SLLILSSSGLAGGPAACPTSRTVDWVRHPEGTDRIEVIVHNRSTDRIVHVEVEVDPDLLEEFVADRDKPHLDGDLKILEPAELFQKIRDLLMNLLRLPNHQAQRAFMLRQSTLASHFFPVVGGDGGGDQFR